MHNTLDIEIFIKVDNGSFKINLETAKKFSNKKPNEDISMLYGVTIDKRRFNYGSVFYNEKTKEVLIVSSIIASDKGLNHLVSFGFIKFDKADTFKDLNQLHQYEFKNRLQNAFRKNNTIKFTPIEDYLKENEVVYKGNLILETFYENEELYNKFYTEIGLGVVQYNNVRHLFKHLNESLTFYNENNIETQFNHFYQLNMIKLDTLVLEPFLALLTYKYHNKSDTIFFFLSRQNCIRVNKLNNHVIMYGLNDELKSTIYLPIDNDDIGKEITTSNSVFSNKYIEKILSYSLKDNDDLNYFFLDAKDEKYDDYFLKFI